MSPAFHYVQVARVAGGVVLQFGVEIDPVLGLQFAPPCIWSLRVVVDRIEDRKADGWSLRAVHRGLLTSAVNPFPESSAQHFDSRQCRMRLRHGDIALHVSSKLVQHHKLSGTLLGRDQKSGLCLQLPIKQVNVRAGSNHQNTLST